MIGGRTRLVTPLQVMFNRVVVPGAPVGRRKRPAAVHGTGPGDQQVANWDNQRVLTTGFIATPL